MSVNGILFRAKRCNGVERLVGVGLQVLCSNNETSSWVRFNADGFACVLANDEFTVDPSQTPSPHAAAHGLSRLANDLHAYIADRQQADIPATLPNVIRYARTHCAASGLEVFNAIAELYRAEKVLFDTSRAVFHASA